MHSSACAQKEKFGGAYCIIILLFLIDLLCENYIVKSFDNKLSNTSWLTWFFIMMSVQVCFAPIQAAASDHFTRKRTIYVALVSNLLCIPITWFLDPSNHSQFWVIPLDILFKCVTGNLIPLALVSVSDMRKTKHRPYFLGTSSTYALAFILIRYAISGLNTALFSFFLISLILIVVPLTRFFFYDEEDKTSDVIPLTKGYKPADNLLKRFSRGIYKVPATLRIICTQAGKDRANLVSDLSEKAIRSALMGYFWWEVSMYSIVASVVDLGFFPNALLFPLFMMGGYLIGALVVFTVFSKYSDQQVIKWGYFISTASLLPFFFLAWGVESTRIITVEICYFFHAAGNAFLSAAFMSLLANERSHHVQGRTYGLIDSSDSIAFMVGTIVGLCFNAIGLKIISLVIFSFVSFLMSFKYYKRYQKGHVLS